LKPSYFFKATESAAKLSLYDILRMVRERFISKSKYVDHYYRDAEYVTEKATRWLRKNRDSGAFFLFLHYMDPHDPFFMHPYNGQGYARVSMPHPPLEMAQELSTTYDGEIAFWDHHFGVLLEFLREEDLLDESIVVVTADHGEEFAEHGGWWHGTTLYEEQIHVPLLIRLPEGLQGGSKVANQVRLLDLAPTLLDRCGISPPGTMQGVSLRWENPDFAGIEYVYAEEDLEGNLLEAVRTDSWKLVKANQNNRRGLEPLELYDLISDPLERRSLVDLEPKEVKQLQGLMDDIGRQAVEAAVKEQTRELDSETRDQLRALGYME
jgi:arylsulfatase A-like enzyme